MAGPVAAYVQLPTDAGNTGKLNRTQTRVIGGNTVHEQFIVRARQAQLLGQYRMATAQLAVVASATNGTSTGLLWISNPTATTNKSARIRRAWITTQHSTVLATPTAPRFRLDRTTFTGTASGAAITAAKIDSTFGAPILDLRTAVTGMTVSLVAQVGSAGICGALTAVGAYAPAMCDLITQSGEEDDFVVLAPGEGLVLYQDTAGTSSDTRLGNFCMAWDEIDTA